MAEARTAADDEQTLKELKERWDYASRAWQEIRDEGATDMRYVAGDPWPPEERRARKDAGRPCLSLDEIGQYVNQVINDVRQNSRAIKVTPIGDGANDDTARLRADLIRQIEYRSNAQQAYTTMFENAVQRSFGYLRVNARYVDDRSFDQELLIEPMPNPDDVTPDPDGVRTDGSDWRYCFIRESRTHAEFAREFPHAKVTNFGAETIAANKQWVTESKVYLAEYWHKVVRKRRLLLLAGQADLVFADELKAVPTDKGAVVRSREVEETTVESILTNGIEILSRTPWPGRHLPIVPCFGKVLYVDEGAGSTRKILSMVRLARDPYMLYCYYRTSEAELVGMTPKTPFIGYEGQFRGHENDWSTVNQAPKAYIEARPLTDATGQNVLPLPQRQPYDPPIQALEIGAESARRAIQAAMATNPLPTSAQRRNEKSGVALKEIEDSAQKGSFHFIDHYDEAIARTGVLLDDLIPHYYDTPRDVTTRDAAGSVQQVRINDPEAPAPESQQPVFATQGRHDVTISTGPSFDSEREAASDFADLLVQNPQVFPLIADLVIKLKNLGPIGDELAERVSLLMPPEARAVANKRKGGAPDAAQLQQQLAELTKMLEVMQGELEAKTRVIETDQVKAQAQLQQTQVKESEQSARTLAEIEAEAARDAAKLAMEQQKLAIEEMRLQLEARKLEVQLEIEMAKLGSARSMARAELEQQDLHHHDDVQLQQQAQLEASAQADLDRQADAEARQAEAAASASEGGDGASA